MSSTSKKKRFGFWKLLIWIVVIVVALNTISDGKFGDWLSSLVKGNSAYQPDPQQQEGYLGISVEEKTDVTGGFVSRVEPDSPGADAGLLVGDIIVTIGDTAINTAADVKAQVGAFHAGDSTVFTVLRDGQYLTLEVVFGVKPQENIPTTPETDPPVSIPGETAPTDQEAPQADRLPSVPEELRNHVYLGQRDRGYCEKLTGKVVVTVIFVSDPDAAWTDGEISAVQSELSDAVSRIRGDAAGYGAQVDLSLQYKAVSVSTAITDGEETQWVESALAAAGLPERTKLNTALEAAYGADSAPVVFVANHGGRANAVRSGSGNEYAVLYENAHAFYHELSHIFGAEDFYYPGDVKKLAETYLPNSIMVNSSDGVMEDFTAYLIGWTDTLSQNALNFLRATSYLTREYLAAEKEKESYTGYVTDYAYGGGSYTGYLVDGVKHGQGKWIRVDGTVWEGSFHYGVFTGRGNVIFSDGDTYDGQWVDGKRHGTGTYKWTDGSSYTGTFTENQQTGKGTWTGASGNTYTGDFVNGKFHGYGVFCWTDGTKYSGGFENGLRSGEGTMVYQDGGVYKGQWRDGDRHGQGTYTDPSGNVYTGQWEKNLRSGQGTLAYANGNSYVGSWSNNTWNGEGTFTWTGGDKYTGNFVDGKRHGYGIYYYPNGNRYEGEWANGERNGYGTMYYANGTSKTGNWNNGAFVG